MRLHQPQSRATITRTLFAATVGLSLFAAMVRDQVVKLDRLDIRNFGAIADDGKDDQPALQAAIDAAAADPKGGTVRVPAGTWNLFHPVHLWGDKVEIKGKGPSSVVKGGDGHAGPMILVGMPTRKTPPGARFTPPSGVYDQSAGDRQAINTTGHVLAASGHPFQFGRGTERTGPEGWSGADPFGFDYYFGQPEGVVWPDGCHLWGLADDQMAPAPFIFKAVAGGFALDVKTTNGEVQRLTIPADRSLKRWRISGQYDPATGRGAAWVEHMHAGGMGPTTGPGLEIRRGDGLAPFELGGCRYNANQSAQEQTPQLVYGFRLTRGAIYRWDGPQAFQGDPRPVNDELQFFMPTPTTEPDAYRVGFLPLNDGTDQGATVSTISPGARQQLSYCPAVPPTGFPPIPSRARIERLDIQGTGQAPVHVGRVLGLTIEGCSITLASQAIGNFPLGVWYPAVVKDCELSGWDAVIVASNAVLSTSNIDVPGGGVDCLRFKGGHGTHRAWHVWRIPAWANTIVEATGSDDGFSFQMGDFILDNEERDDVPKRAVFHFTQGAFQTGNVTLESIYPSCVPLTCAVVELTGRGVDQPFAPYHFEMKNVGSFGMHGAAARVTGAGWYGEIDSRMLPGAGFEGDVRALAITKQ